MPIFLPISHETRFQPVTRLPVDITIRILRFIFVFHGDFFLYHEREIVLDCSPSALVSICTVHCLLRRPNPDCEIQTFISPYVKFVFGVSFRLNIWFDVKHLHLLLHESSSPVRSIRSLAIICHSLKCHLLVSFNFVVYKTCANVKAF